MYATKSTLQVFIDKNPKLSNQNDRDYVKFMDRISYTPKFRHVLCNMDMLYKVTYGQDIKD